MPKTFLNKDYCVPRETCSSISYASQYFTLSEAVVQQFYELDGLYVYAVKVVGRSSFVFVVGTATTPTRRTVTAAPPPARV